MPAFNRNAAAKFKELAPEAKHRYDELATVEEGEELTENQKARRVSSIFTKLRDHTVSVLASIYSHQSIEVFYNYLYQLNLNLVPETTRLWLPHLSPWI